MVKTVKTGLSGILNLPPVEGNPRLSGYKVRERSNGWSKIEGDILPFRIAFNR